MSSAKWRLFCLGLNELTQIARIYDADVTCVSWRLKSSAIDCSSYSLFRQTTKKTPKPSLLDLYEGIRRSPVM